MKKLFFLIIILCELMESSAQSGEESDIMKRIIRVCSTTQPPKISAKTAASQCDKALT